MAILRVKVDYPTIQDAVDAASPGDRILVESGTYPEQVAVSKNFLQIIGESGVILDGQNLLGSAFVLYKSNGVQVKKFKMMNYKFDTISIINSAYTVITQNILWGSGDTGINLFDASGTLISENCIGGIGNYGIFSDQSPTIRIQYNTIFGNGRTGIFIASAEADSDITDNKVFKNKQHGIVNYGRNSRIIGNILCGNNDGVYLMARSLLENNDVRYNREDGVQVYGEDSIIRDNRIYYNGGYGMFINYTGGSHTVINNRVLNNKGNGLFVGSGHNAISGNWAEDNSNADLTISKSDNLVMGNCCTGSNPAGYCEPCPRIEEAEENVNEMQRECLKLQKKKLEALKEWDSSPVFIDSQNAIVRSMEKQFENADIEREIMTLLERYPADNG